MTAPRKRVDPAALEPYRQAGLTVIPLNAWDLVDGRGRRRGKSPRDSNWQVRPYDHDEVVAEAVERGTNVGVRIPANWMVLDVDPRNFPPADPDGDPRDPAEPRRDVLMELNLELDLELGTAPRTTTGSGGWHFWYRKPADVDMLDSLKDYPGIEFKSKGRQVVAASSTHPGDERNGIPPGNAYEWDPTRPPLGAAREVPAGLLLLARRQQMTAGTRGSGELTPEQLTEALEQLPVEDFREHDRWRDLMMSCLSGDTEILTREHGVVPIGSLAGQRVTLLDGNRDWVECEVRDRGVQETRPTTFRRGTADALTVRSTATHRWILEHGGETTTAGLRPGARVASLRPSRAVADEAEHRRGVVHGIVYGDGSAVRRRLDQREGPIRGRHTDRGLADRQSHTVRVYDRSHKAGLHGWLSEFASHRIRLDDCPGTLYNIPKRYTADDLKALPDPALVTTDYLLGFLRGWLATDGCVSTVPNANICCGADEGEWLRRFGPIVGWRVLGAAPSPYGNPAWTRRKESLKFTIKRETLGEDDLLLAEHRRRWGPPGPGQHWNVLPASDRRTERVYCPVVPTTHSFALGNGIHSGNCHHATAGEGRQEFIDWSTGDANYTDRAWEVGRRWDSLHHELQTVGQNSRPITARFLYQQILSRGGSVPIDPPEVDFEPVEVDGDEDTIPEAGDGATPEAERRSMLEEMNARHCWSGDVEILTREQGATAIGPLAGRWVTLLDGDREWTRCLIVDHGTQETHTVTLRRGREVLALRATAHHGWRTTRGEMLTRDLMCGTSLEELRPRTGEIPTEAYRRGVIHGLVYGDGTAVTRERDPRPGPIRGRHTPRAAACPRSYSICTYRSSHAESLDAWLSGFTASPTKPPRPAGTSFAIPGSYARGIDLKALPDAAASPDGYLLGFLRGWLAADGCVAERGQVSIACGGAEAEWLRTWAPTIGWRPLGAAALPRETNYGRRNKQLYSLGLSRASVTAEDLLLAEHRRRFEARPPRQLRWKVESVGPGRAERVYCPSVPTTGSFALGNLIHSLNCVVDDAGKFRIYSDKFDPVLGRQYFVQSTQEDFVKLYANRLVEQPQPDGETKVVRLGDWWIRQANRRQYEGVLFDPERSHEGWLNLWTGWSVEQARGDWSLLRRLLEENLCLAGDTPILTREHGVVPIAEVAGREVTLLDGAGHWVRCPVADRGEQETVAVAFTRSGQRAEVRSTAAHWWVLATGARTQTRSLTATTDRVGSVVPRNALDENELRRGIVHGIVYGDGTARNAERDGAGAFSVDIHVRGNKACLSAWLSEFASYPMPPTGPEGTTYFVGKRWTSGRDLKALPDPTAASDSYLLGFLRGWLATDGTVTAEPAARIACGREETAWLRRWAPVVGWIPLAASRLPDETNLGRRNKELFHLNIRRASLSPDDLLVDMHRRRWEATPPRAQDWKPGVPGERRVERVYCPVVPTTHSFALGSLMHSGNCDGDEELARYVLDWTAYMVQHPSRPAEVAIAFRGAKGTGKGTWGRTVASLAGKHGLHISSPEHLVGRFNAHLRDCLTHSTPILTREHGSVPIGDVAGQWVTLLDANRDWVKCRVNDLGEQTTYATRFSGGSGAEPVEVRSTARHGWVTAGGMKVLTRDLKRQLIGDLRPRRHSPPDEAEHRRGVIHGMVYGDGSRTEHGHQLSVFAHGYSIAPWMEGFSSSPARGEGKLGPYEGTTYYIGARYTRDDLKSLPDPTAVGQDYLLGFLRGWLATDGCVSAQPQASISCGAEEVAWLRRWAPLVGWQPLAATPQPEETSLGRRNKPMFHLTFRKRTIHRGDLLVAEHRSRWQGDAGQRHGWRVVASGLEPRTERVYCPEVPTTGSFALGCGIHSSNCICLFADEAFWAGDKKGESVLKQLVTEPTIAYEAKGKDVVPGRNLIHVLMASNSEWVVPAGMDRERRFCVAEVNQGRVGDKEFFRELHRQLADGGLGGLLYDMLTRPIGDWSPRDSVPQTRGLVDQKIRSMDAQAAWWYARLQDGFLPNQRGPWADGPTTVMKEYLRRDFQQSAKDAGWGRAGSETEFGLRMSRLCPGVSARQLTATQDEFGIKTDVKGRAMAYVLPPLGRCREAMEEQVGGRLTWPEDGGGDEPHLGVLD